MSPDLITVHEGEQLILRCAFCAVSLNATTLSWYKEGLLISNGSRHVIANDELGIPVVDHREDEGLYECTVTSRNHSISRYITVIVRKGEIYNFNTFPFFFIVREISTLWKLSGTQQSIY